MSNDTTGGCLLGQPGDSGPVYIHTEGSTVDVFALPGEPGRLRLLVNFDIDAADAPALAVELLRSAGRDDLADALATAAEGECLYCSAPGSQVYALHDDDCPLRAEAEATP